VIDGDGQHPPSRDPRPIGRHAKQGDRIPASGQSDRDGMIRIPLQPGVQNRSDPLLQSGRRTVRVQRQFAWVRVRAAISRNAGVEEAA
jgi:hypothetical protein